MEDYPQASGSAATQPLNIFDGMSAPAQAHTRHIPENEHVPPLLIEDIPSGRDALFSLRKAKSTGVDMQAGQDRPGLLRPTPALNRMDTPLHGNAAHLPTASVRDPSLLGHPHGPL